MAEVYITWPLRQIKFRETNTVKYIYIYVTQQKFHTLRIFPRALKKPSLCSFKTLSKMALNQMKQNKCA